MEGASTKNSKLVVLVLLVVAIISSASAETMYSINRVYVRKEPNLNSQTYGILDPQNGDTVKVIKTGTVNGKKWVYGNTKFGYGFVSYWSLSTIKPDLEDVANGYLEARTSLTADKVTLIAKRNTIAEQNGKIAKVKAGTRVEATRFYPDGRVVVKAPNGRNCNVPAKDFKLGNGKALPSFPKTKKLRVSMSVEGMTLNAGKKLNVEYYVLYKNQCFAYVYEGYINIKYLK